MEITTSPDITNLDVSVQFDISNATPAVNVTNESTGTRLANCTWWFVILSPSQTFIHQGSATIPDITGNWSSHIFTDAWPRPFNQIEWSGAPYSCQVYVKDSNGTIYTNAPQTASICRPAGNTQNSKNTYGLASSVVAVKCQEARIFFQDTTYHSYKGLDGTYNGSTLRVIYPIDETATIPTPFEISNYSTVLVPISYSSNNYQFFQQDFYNYDLGANTSVKIRYQVIQTFAVWCNVDLEPLVCEFNTLINDIQTGNCANVQEATNKLTLIAPKMTLVFMGIMQPLTGIDVPALIEEIKAIGGFSCECCSAATGIIPTTASVIDGYTFSVVKACGDISGTVTTTGTNIQFNLSDVSYIVNVCNESPSETTAFSFVPSQTGCQKTYCLKIDGNQLATDILNIISNDSSLINFLNSLVNTGTGNFNLLVDGKCIFQTTSSCDYLFSLLNVPATTTFALLTSIRIDSITHTLNFAFNGTNLPELQSYLNGLGYGTFVVANLGAGQVSITSTNNPNNIVALNYSIANVNYVATMTKSCTGYIPISANVAVQNIINYLCGLTDAEVETASDYVICYVDPVDKTNKQVTVSAGAAVSDFTIELLARNCDTISYIMSLNAITCDSMKGIFPQSAQVMQTNDYVLGTKNGACARILPEELATVIFNLALSNPTVLVSFCAVVTACAGGTPCTPFNFFYLTVPYSSPTDDTMDIIVNFQNPSAVSFTIRYARIDNTNTPTYITIPGVITSPYLIDNVADGQYSVGITPIYADGRTCPEMFQTTTACTGINSFSAVLGGSPISEFVISYSAIVTMPKLRVNIAYPNGGSSSAIYTNTGTDIHITFPTAVYGNFSITLTPVCNENTGFFGAPTAPIILNVTNPNPITTPLQVSLTRSGTGATGALFASVLGGVSPFNYTYTFSAITGGTCPESTIDNPTGSVPNSGGEAFISTTYSNQFFAGATYSFRVTVSDGFSTVVSNTVVAPTCLIPETPIMLKDGVQIKLSDLKVGDKLFGDDDNEVLTWEEFEVDQLYVINSGLAGGGLETSEGHVNICSGELVQSADLFAGIHTLTGKDGNDIVIHSLEIRKGRGKYKVINISTTNKTYIANGLLTHNKSACPS